MTLTTIVFDLICLAILIFCAAWYAHKGFLAGIVSLVGTIAVFFGALYAANALAVPIFDRFFRPDLTERAAEAFRQVGAEAFLQGGAEALRQMIGQIAGFVPGAAVQDLAAQLAAAPALNAEVFAERMVTELIQPMVAPLIVLGVFLILFLALRLVLSFVVWLLTKARHVPVLGTANKALGAVMGVFLGAFYLFLLVALLRAGGAAFPQSPLAPSNFEGSVVYGLLGDVSVLPKTGA